MKFTLFDSISFLSTFHILVDETLAFEDQSYMIESLVLKSREKLLKQHFQNHLFEATTKNKIELRFQLSAHEIQHAKPNDVISCDGDGLNRREFHIMKL